MWIFTLDGFYSVVADRDDPATRLLVRCRDESDAYRMAESLGLTRHDVLHTPEADYAYRIKVPHETFAALMAGEVQEIDYTNFKNAVHRLRGSDRADIYEGVWGFLRDALQEGHSPA